ncbi:diacylglycerol kinase eta isoform X1 [Monodelphis domestica]|uniref:diacylglycerol kinase eta isoform X1 n=3 Tax=Monodelphis domestica TaxID=13616 RepID=UPI0024E25097|nr:diacylglycerol kinase eta isoform X1 [Monodelphis domestica]
MEPQHVHSPYSARSPVWEELESERMAGAGVQHHPPGTAGASTAASTAATTASATAAAAAGPVEESSDSEAEHEGPQKLIRKVSTSGQIRSKVRTSIKEGLLLKQTSSFQRWKKRYFKLRGRTLYYAKDSKSLIFDEVDLSDASVAESSTKNVNNSFTIITPFRRLVLCAENRKEMEEWISLLKSVQSRELYEAAQFNVEHFSGMHNWYACSHARPTFCNVCRESLSGVTSHGLSCEVCKFKAHKRCAVRATNNCKWTTLASIGKDIIEDEDGIAMPHQWLEGNLPVSAKCAVCDKTCGSVLRLQDWKCLWCKAMVHTACKELFPYKCPLDQCKVSTIPPIALNSIDSDGFWKATAPPSRASPLLVFVNSKSGDNQGVKFLRRFKQLLNPAQVFDLINGGPHLGLRLFQKFDNFRILVCGGDGSVGWVLSEIDKLNLHKQCQLGVLPLGTGNDLARVLGWGGSCDDDTQLPQILEKLERASTKMLDRWSIMTYELKLPTKPSLLPITSEEENEESHISSYEDSVATHLAKILNSDQHSVVISSAKILCQTVKDFVAKVGKTYERTEENSDVADTMALKCEILNEKLDQLLQTLHAEAQTVPVYKHHGLPSSDEEPINFSSDESLSENKARLMEDAPKITSQKTLKPRELMLRANSLKKAVRQIIEQAEKVVDEQNVHIDEEGNLMSSPLDDSKETEYSKDDDGKEYTSVKTATRAPETCLSQSCSTSTSISGPILTSNKENLPVLNARIICPGLRAGLAASIAGSSIISKMLLANIDPFGATPFIDPDPESLEGYSEKCVMNNYFGIGLDAKISLEFNNKREEHPEKCRSRTKNMMWYGVLGTKELLQRTYKNLEQRVQLECDGQYIPLPSLQGIAVLNIPSYAGGTNFWGGTKEDDIFTAPSFDDKILEVVAVFGSMQMAMSRVIKLQHHRIAQCRSVKITILGDEGVPVQVDGEAWIQPPGIIKIVHKNRAQMLTRDRAFENTLKSWEDKQKYDAGKVPPRPQQYLQQAVDLATEEEVNLMQHCSQAAEELITRICEAAKVHSLLEQELAHAVNACSHALNKANPRFPESLTRDTAIEIAVNVKALNNETESLLIGRVPLQLESPHEELVTNALHGVEVELQKLSDIPWLHGVLHSNDDEDPPLDYTKRNKSTMFRIVPKFKKEKVQKLKGSPLPVQKWGTDEVAAWLDQLNLGEYTEIFIRHDIRGAELLHLERRDLKDLGITKVGHMKRILQGIKELGKSTLLSEV